MWRRDWESWQGSQQLRNDESRNKNRSLAYRRRELNILDNILLEMIHSHSELEGLKFTRARGVALMN